MNELTARSIRALVDRESTPAAVPVRQERSWTCGPAALVNVCSFLGLDVTEQEIRERAGTTWDGTDEDQLIDAIHGLGLDTEVIFSSDAGGSWRRLVSILESGTPCLLCVDRWDHWVAVTHLDGDAVVMLDPAHEESDILDQDELTKRWEHPSEDRAFYAIAVRHP